VATKHDGFKDFVLDPFFGIIHKGRLYFKTDRITVTRYHDRGMKPFKPSAAQTLKNYHEVPVEALEDSDDLTTWASQAIQR
jgi:DNA transformation protein